MGLIVGLEFGDGIRSVELVYGLTPSARTVTFMDDSPVEPGSYEDKFVKDYKEHGLDAIMHSRVDPLRRYWHDEWVEAFVEAVQEQGPSAYGEHLDEYDIAKMIYAYAYEPDDYDYIQHVIKFEKEKTVIEWMINDLVEAIRAKGYHHPSVSNIANAMIGYVNSEDIKVDLSESGGDGDHRRSFLYGEYTVRIRNTIVASWTEETKYEICDPMTFGGYFDEDYFISPEGYDFIRSNIIDMLSEFDINLPEMGKPTPPDHPKPVEDGEFGVIHEYDEDFDMEPDLAGTWDVAQFKSAADAKEAMALSDSIYENISYPAHVVLTLVRKLSPEDAAYAKSHFDYMIAYAAMSGEPTPKDWEMGWKRLDEEED